MLHPAMRRKIGVRVGSIREGGKTETLKQKLFDNNRRAVETLHPTMREGNDARVGLSGVNSTEERTDGCREKYAFFCTISEAAKPRRDYMKVGYRGSQSILLVVHEQYDGSIAAADKRPPASRRIPAMARRGGIIAC